MGKIIPAKATLIKTAKDGVIGGVVGGLSVGVCRGIFGLGLGSVAGGVIGGALLNGYDPDIAKIVAVNGTMDFVASGFLGE